jgi:hypothetical protein
MASFTELSSNSEVEAVRMLVELYVKANRVEEALTAAKRGITVCKEMGDAAAQVRLRSREPKQSDED